MSSHHDSEGKPKRDSKVLILTPNSNRKYDLNVHADRERFVQEVVIYFTTWHKKLKELKPQIEQVRELFAQHVRGSVTLCGCGSFKEFCLTKLGVKTEQAVYAMLGNYSEKVRKQRAPKGERERDDEIPRQAVMRMRTALDKVQQARHAKTEAEAAEAWRAYDEIAEARVTEQRPTARPDSADPELPELRGDIRERRLHENALAEVALPVLALNSDGVPALAHHALNRFQVILHDLPLPLSRPDQPVAGLTPCGRLQVVGFGAWPNHP